MLFGLSSKVTGNQNLFKSVHLSDLSEGPDLSHIKFYRKDKSLSPDNKNKRPSGSSPDPGRQSRRAFFFTPLFKGTGRSRPVFLSGSLTVEAAVAVPVFFLCMMAVIQYGNVYNASVRIGTAMSQTAQEMAMGAYVTEYGEGGDILSAALSVGYAHGRTISQAGDLSSVRSLNFILSEFLEENDMIRLIAAYRVRQPFGLVKAPGNFFVQTASVRGWTGRKGSDGKSGKKEEGSRDSGKKVYVTQYGTVYHTDPNCSHIHLHISQTSREGVKKKRNIYGEKYHRCEECGGRGDVLYITSDGNRYHSSLTCPGLKRSVREVTMDEAEGLRPCSRCAGGGK